MNLFQKLKIFNANVKNFALRGLIEAINKKNQNDIKLYYRNIKKEMSNLKIPLKSKFSQRNRKIFF